MATGLQTEERINRIDIADFVQSATWRELLIELVESKKLDPWDIDISKMLDAYIEAVRKMKVLDLHLPANVILAASILLRMKSESLSSYGQEDSIEEEPERFVRQPVDVPDLTMKARMQPGRHITLQELLDAMEGAMRVQEGRARRSEEIQLPIRITIGDDIDSRTKDVHSLLKRSVDSFGMATFSGLARKFNSMEDTLLKLFIPLLYLAQKEVIAFSQEEVFGEIIIKMLDGHAVRGKKD